MIERGFAVKDVTLERLPVESVFTSREALEEFLQRQFFEAGFGAFKKQLGQPGLADASAAFDFENQPPTRVVDLHKPPARSIEQDMETRIAVRGVYLDPHQGGRERNDFGRRRITPPFVLALLVIGPNRGSPSCQQETQQGWKKALLVHVVV